MQGKSVKTTEFPFACLGMYKKMKFWLKEIRRGMYLNTTDLLLES